MQAFGCSFGAVGCDSGTATIGWDGTQTGLTGVLSLDYSAATIDMTINAALAAPLWLVANPPDLGRSAIVFVSASYTGANLAVTEIASNEWIIDPGQTATAFWTQQDFDGSGQPIGGPVNMVAASVAISGQCDVTSLVGFLTCNLTFGPDGFASGSWSFSHKLFAAVVPEPSMATLLGLAVLMLGLLRNTAAGSASSAIHRTASEK